MRKTRTNTSPTKWGVWNNFQCFILHNSIVNQMNLFKTLPALWQNNWNTCNMCAKQCFRSTGKIYRPISVFQPSSKIFYWPFQWGTSFVHFSCFFCLVFAMPLCASVYLCLVVTCCERADLLAPVCGVLLWVCHFHIGILGQMWYLIVSIPDLCTLTYFSVNLKILRVLSYL